MRHINRNRLTAALAAASISLIAPAAAVLAGTAAASAGAPNAGVVARDVASSGTSGADAPSDGATDGSGDGTDSSNEVTDGNGDLCDPGVVPTDAPSASSTDSATSTDTTDSTDSTDDGPGDTSCDDSHANLVGAVARAARAQVKAGRRARIAVDVTTARGTALATGKAVLFERKTRVAVADVVAGKVTFSARGLSRGTHRLRVGLVSSTGTVVRAATVLRVTVR